MLFLQSHLNRFGSGETGLFGEVLFFNMKVLLVKLRHGFAATAAEGTLFVCLAKGTCETKSK